MFMEIAQLYFMRSKSLFVCICSYMCVEPRMNVKAADFYLWQPKCFIT
jgi:hypothetical protein